MMRIALSLLIVVVAGCSSNFDHRSQSIPGQGWAQDGERVVQLHTDTRTQGTRRGPVLPGSPPSVETDSRERWVDLKIWNPDADETQTLVEGLAIPDHLSLVGGLYYRPDLGYLVVAGAEKSVLYDLETKHAYSADRPVIPSPSGERLMVVVRDTKDNVGPVHLRFVDADVIAGPPGALDLAGDRAESTDFVQPVAAPTTCAWMDDATVHCQSRGATLSEDGTWAVAAWRVDVQVGTGVQTDPVAEDCAHRNQALQTVSGRKIEWYPPETRYRVVQREACPWALE